MRRVVIRDDNKQRLGVLKVPDGATEDEVALEYQKYKQILLAKRAAKEVARTEPVGDRCLCPFCRAETPLTEIGVHIPKCARKAGIDIGDGPQ
jgi:hypothetical protein